MFLPVSTPRVDDFSGLTSEQERVLAHLDSVLVVPEGLVPQDGECGAFGLIVLEIFLNYRPTVLLRGTQGRWALAKRSFGALESSWLGCISVVVDLGNTQILLYPYACRTIL